VIPNYKIVIKTKNKNKGSPIITKLVSILIMKSLHHSPYIACLEPLHKHIFNTL